MSINSLHRRGYEPSDVEVAWAAGLFEGEGSITASRQPNGHVKFITLVLTMTDEDTVERFAKIVDYADVKWYYYGPEKDRIKYQWQTNKFSEVKRIFELLEPWLGERRQAKGRQLLEEYLTTPRIRLALS